MADNTAAFELLALLQRIATGGPGTEVFIPATGETVTLSDLTVQMLGTLVQRRFDEVDQNNATNRAAHEAQQATGTEIDPLLIADIEDHFATIDDSLIATALSQAEAVIEIDQDSLDAAKARLMAATAEPTPEAQELDPILIAEIEYLFAVINPMSYLEDIVAAESPEAAQAAYEQLVTNEWDGDL